MQPAPARGANPVAHVVGEAERRQAVPGDDADPGPERPVAAGKGNGDANDARVHERVAEQRETMQRHHRQRAEGKRFVDRTHVALVDSRPARA